MQKLDYIFVGNPINIFLFSFIRGYKIPATIRKYRSVKFPILYVKPTQTFFSASLQSHSMESFIIKCNSSSKPIPLMLFRAYVRQWQLWFFSQQKWLMQLMILKKNPFQMLFNLISYYVNNFQLDRPLHSSYGYIYNVASFFLIFNVRAFQKQWKFILIKMPIYCSMSWRRLVREMYKIYVNGTTIDLNIKSFKNDWTNECKMFAWIGAQLVDGDGYFCNFVGNFVVDVGLDSNLGDENLNIDCKMSYF
jgi:hypothetical protein